jgi:hypothetical protein
VVEGCERKHTDGLSARPVAAPILLAPAPSYRMGCQPRCVALCPPKYAEDATARAVG